MSENSLSQDEAAAAVSQLAPRIPKRNETRSIGIDGVKEKENDHPQQYTVEYFDTQNNLLANEIESPKSL